MDNMIIIDIETQTFSVDSGIYEVACLVVENYEIVDSLHLGIHDESYSGSRMYGYGFYDISQNQNEINKFRELLIKYNYPIVAHNCPFDKKFLDYYEWVDVERKYYCSMRAIRGAEKELKSYSLDSLVSYYKVANNVKHEAIDDVLNLYKLLNIIRPETWYEVGKRSKHAPKKKPRDKEVLAQGFDISTTLKDEVVCFTGKSEFTRSEMQEIVFINGGEISKGISLATTMLVVGEDAGSKLDKAQEKGIVVISDNEFMEIVGENVIR